MNQKSAITVEAEALALVNQFERGVADVFDQLVKGNWVDELGHLVKNNQAVKALKVPMMGALSLRARVEAAPAAPAVPAEPSAAVIDRMCEFDVIRNRRPHDRELAKLIYRAIIEQQAAPAAPAAPAPAGGTFEIMHPHYTETAPKRTYTLTEFCIRSVDIFGLTGREIAAVISLQVGKSFTNENVIVRRVA